MTVQPIYWGAESLANTITTSIQSQPTVTALAGGGFVVSWTDDSLTAPDASQTAVYAQVYDALGAKVGSQVLVNTTTSGFQQDPDTVALANGGFDIFFRNGGADPSVTYQEFNASGVKVGGEIGISTLGATADQVSVARLDGGGVAATWIEFTGTTFDIQMQRFTGANATVGSTVTVNTITALGQTEPDIAALGNGRFVVTWTDLSASSVDVSGATIRMQIYNDNGAAVGGEILVPTNFNLDQKSSSVTGLGNGNFIVAWTDTGNGLDANLSGSVAQMFNQDGVKIGSEFLLNTTTTGDQNVPSLTALPGGSFMAMWHNGVDVTGQVFATDGGSTPTKVGNEINGNQGTSAVGFGEGPVLATLADGRVVVAYGDIDGPASSGVGVQILDPRGAFIDGTSAGEIITGANNAAVLSDAINGFGGNDTIWGFAADDSINGGTGDDAMHGGAGNDTYFVDSALDTVFENLNGGNDFIVSRVNYTLSANVEGGRITGTATSLTGNGLDNVIDGDGIDNTLSGLGGNDTLTEGAGNSILDGGTGADSMTGGGGNDTYIVDNAGDTVHELAGGGLDTEKTTISLTLSAEVENGVLLGAANLNLTGNSLANALTGNAGVNTLDGGAGDDTLDGGAGKDVLGGGDGLDKLTGGLGRDVMTGGLAADVFDFNSKADSGKTAATRDVIKDFTHGLDHIDLKDIDANSKKPFDQKFHFIGTQAFHNKAGELHYTKINLPGKAHDKTIVEGDINGDGKADFQIELSHLVKLTVGDFVL